MSQQGGGGGQDSSSGILWGIGVLFVAMFIIGKFWGEHIGKIYIYLKLAELNSMFFLHGFFPEMKEAKFIMEEALKAQSNGEKLGISLSTYMAIGKIVGSKFNILFVSILAWHSWKIFQQNPMQKFRRVLSMKDLAKSEQKLWFAIAPVVNLNLIDEPINEGAWAMSQTPLEFAKKYKLLNPHEKDKLTLDEDASKKAEKLFASQLGKLWAGPNKLPPYIRGLFACFIAHGAGDKDGALRGLEIMARTFSSGKQDFSWAKALLEKHYTNPAVQKIIKQHAYVYTVMATALEYARGMGVLPSNNFIWLKPTNRSLWFVLNGVGRNVAFAEVAGIYAHWLAEKVALHPIEKPYVKKAVKALELALQEVKIE